MAMIETIVRQALREDAASADITTRILVPKSLCVEAVIVAKEAAVVSALQYVKRSFLMMDRRARISLLVKDGDRVRPGQKIVRIQARAAAVLSAERTALNFLGRMSGIATLTRSFVEAVSQTSAVILDTRKTAPGLRLPERDAVRAGGGINHRFDLSAMVLVKDNHRSLAAVHGSLADVVRLIRRATTKKVEVEVDNLSELADVLHEPPDIVLLDNMNTTQLRQAVRMVMSLPQQRRPLLEASGGITLANVRAVAKTGVNRISVGAITHSAPSVDVSLEIIREIHA